MFQRDAGYMWTAKDMFIGFKGIASRTVRTVERVASVNDFARWQDLMSKLNDKVIERWVRSTDRFESRPIDLNRRIPLVLFKDVVMKRTVMWNFSKIVSEMSSEITVVDSKKTVAGWKWQ